MKYFVLPLITLLSLSAYAADYDEVAATLPGRSFEIDIGRSSLQMSFGNDQTMTVTSEKWGDCTGKMKVVPGDSANGVIIMDNGGLFCSKVESLPKYIMFQLEVPNTFDGNSKGNLNLYFKGKWIVSNKTVSISEK
ncbi:hypothetical protein ACLVWU_16975 [Bdellovibrio sp. HCB290]|uniref:hypothetical protein n=1 Tax=Bdellovibrio sp. HCB290 TaxID=3394356 RepID=UPI0039B3DBD9